MRRFNFSLKVLFFPLKFSEKHFYTLEEATHFFLTIFSITRAIVVYEVFCLKHVLKVLNCHSHQTNCVKSFSFTFYYKAYVKTRKINLTFHSLPFKLSCIYIYIYIYTYIHIYCIYIYTVYVSEKKTCGTFCRKIEVF